MTSSMWCTSGHSSMRLFFLVMRQSTFASSLYLPVHFRLKLTESLPRTQSLSQYFCEYFRSACCLRKCIHFIDSLF